MGRNVNIHVVKDGKWVPVGEAYLSTPVYELLVKSSGDQEVILGAVHPNLDKEATPDGATE